MATTSAHAAHHFTGKTIVIKLGTSSILSETTHQPKLSILSSLVETCHELRSAGHRVVLVCSGAIGMGKVRMGFMKPGSTSTGRGTIGERQALAAMGQLRLIALWDTLFGELGINVAQVLLTRNDIADRPRFMNAQNTLRTLLSPPFNAIPIVNENDTVSVSELRFGDNDTLSAITAGLVDADFLFLLTDVDGLYTGNPRNDPRARRLGVVGNVGKVRKIVNVTSLGSNFGTGGMMTKLIAAELATAAGVATVIINGNIPTNIVKVVEKGVPVEVTTGTTETESKEAVTDLTTSISSLDLEHERDTIGAPAIDNPPHTIFLPVRHPLKSRKWSILHALHPAGTVIIDEGAYERISRPESGGRLLAAGVVGVEGTWERMQAVRLVVRRKLKLLTTEKGEVVTAAIPEQADQINDPEEHIGSGSRSASRPTSAIQTPPNIDIATDEDAKNTTITDWELIEIGRGLANYNSIECERIKGLNSSQIVDVLGYTESDYVVDELALHLTLP
ncbi:glutamate 5-kinase [Meira miltonrushii]|uniref:Glutamate 5-kinase n=1 Tax=Meira miltonrushii TaxID=1280837 RepID=A0A316VM32_9BASI|nr:glutamate 5-kinase [Meira miltonrushii]PWN37161.1 glutamate 5-kinase [Meira miltonrushii]